MENILLIHKDKTVARIFNNLARDTYRLTEIENAENIHDFLSWTDLIILHAPTLREQLIPTTERIHSFAPNMGMVVLVSERKPDYALSLLQTGVKDILSMEIPQEIISRRIRNMVELSSYRQNNNMNTTAFFSNHNSSYHIIEAVKHLSDFVPKANSSSEARMAYLRFTRDFLGVSRICLIAEKQGRFVIKQHDGLPDELAAGISFSPSQGAMAFLLKNMSVLRLDQPYNDSLYRQASDELKRFGLQILLPLISRGRVTGALGLNARFSGMPWTDNDIGLLKALSELIATPVLKKDPAHDPAPHKQEKNISTPISPKPPEAPRSMITEDAYMEFVRTLAMRSSHEFKNALVSIKTFTQLLPKKYKSESFRKDFFNVVEKEVDHLNDLVEDLLFFAQPLECHKLFQDLQEILKDVAKGLSHEYKNIHFKHIADKEINTEIPVDEKLLRIALQNILKNAIDAMKAQGTITLSLKKQESSYLNETPSLCLTIADTGQGVPEAIRQRIFEPFFTTKTKGLGLGLTIAQKIITGHGWDIKLESSKNGSHTVIQIPGRSEETKAAAESTEAGLSRFQDKLLEYHE